MPFIFYKYNISISQQYLIFINYFNVCIVCVLRKLKNLPLTFREAVYICSFLGIFCLFLLAFTYLFNMSNPIISLLPLITLFLDHITYSPTASAITLNHFQILNSNSDFRLSFRPLKSSWPLNICGCLEGLLNTAVQKQVFSLYLQSAIMYTCLLEGRLMLCFYHNKIFLKFVFCQK